jgi:hypothetical protein
MFIDIEEELWFCNKDPYRAFNMFDTCRAEWICFMSTGLDFTA